MTATSHLSLRTESILPELGNRTVTDRLGMGVAILTVVTLLRAGVNTTTIQYVTMRKTQLLTQAQGYTCGTVLGLDKKKQYIYQAVIHLGNGSAGL
jgi:hypothetical protein